MASKTTPSYGLAGVKENTHLYPLDFFPEDFLIMIDENHMTMGQIKGMYNGTFARAKEMLVNIVSVCLLPWIIGHCVVRSLKAMSIKIVYVSAAPGDYEWNKPRIPSSSRLSVKQVFSRQVSAPTTMGQVDSLGCV